MEVTSSPPPALRAPEIEALLVRDYGLSGALTPLVSERDQNFRLDTADGRRFVVKIANAAEAAVVTEFQVAALRHLERSKCPVAVPRVVPTIEGKDLTALLSDTIDHVVRVVTWVPGKPIVGDCPDTRLAWALGQTLALLDAGLRDFEHPGDRQELLWDMQRATELEAQVIHAPEPALRERLGQCFDDFRTRALPRFSGLRHQVIHNDLNPGNVLVSDCDSPGISGVIDFGDMLRAPMVVDVAIAASYMRSDAVTALEPAATLVAGFAAVTPLADDEISLLYDLMRTRLATTITMMYWRIANRADADEYLQKTLQDERSAERFLDKLEATTAERFVALARAARHH